METLPDLSDLRKAELKAAFDLFDADSNGCITIQELGDIFRASGQNPTNEELRKMLNEGQENKNSEYMTYEGFLNLMRKKIQDPETIEELEEAFKIFDPEGKGMINNLDVRQALIDSGDNFSKDELDRIIEEADDDKDGYINYHELVIKLIAEK